MIRKVYVPFLVASVVVLAAAAAFAAGGSGSQLDDCIHLSIQGMADAKPGEDIAVPVVISEVTGWGILAFEMEICWCDLPAGLLQYKGCERGYVMEESGWAPPICSPCESNCISIAAANPYPLSGNGPLFYLIFHVSANAKPCMCCDLRFEYAYLYDPEDPLNVCTSGADVCIEWCDVRGVVKSWYCEYDPCEGWYRPYGLPGVRVHLWDCHGPVASDFTDGKGQFEFLCLDPLCGKVDGTGDDAGSGCFYCAGLDYCEVPPDAIGAYDASLILQYLVCSIDFEYCAFPLNGGVILPQMVAADVNCTGMITAYDAALILQYVVGILPTFPCPHMWNWYVMAPGSCVLDCPGFIEFIGVLKGDVSGPRLEVTGLLSASTVAIKFGMARHAGDSIDIPVLLENATGVCSAEFDFEFKTSDFTLDSVRPAGLADGFLLHYSEHDGHVKVAMAGSAGINGSGRLAVVRLERKPSTLPVTYSRPVLISARLNDGYPSVEIEGRRFDVEAGGFRLGPVSPNPFTAGTAIAFSAPRPAGVSVEIYNVNGQLVRTLFSGQAVAGAHQVEWDGTDESGGGVARGVYFCRMTTPGFSATEKVVLLR
jgi:hypothetical protein